MCGLEHNDRPEGSWKLGMRVVVRPASPLAGPLEPSCRTRSGIRKFQVPDSLDSGFLRNDESLRDNE
jgi:hypothetical protein